MDGKQRSLAVVWTLMAISASITGSVVLRDAAQSSTDADSTARLAVDMNPSTCSVTGYGTENWWKAELDSVVTITGVVINGSSSDVNIRFGLNSDSYGISSEFKENPSCSIVIPGLVIGPADSTYRCMRPLTGKYLSIEGADPNQCTQMKICSVSVIVA